MKTYTQFSEECLQEMEYQAPPKPVEKAPIERKAQQPEKRSVPSLDHAATKKAVPGVKGSNAIKKIAPPDEVKPAGADHGDHPQDPKKQRERSGVQTRRALAAASESLRKTRKGKAQGSDQKRPDKKTGDAPITRKAPPVKGIF